MTMNDGEKNAIKQECMHFRIGGESVLKAIQFAETHGAMPVLDVFGQMHLEPAKQGEGPYVQFYRLLTAKVGTLAETPEMARHTERQDNLKYKYGTNEDEKERKENIKKYIQSRQSPLHVFYGMEKNGGREAAIRQWKRNGGLEPDAKLINYWRENGYRELLGHHGLEEPEGESDE
jgi:hypothetical protein